MQANVDLMSNAGSQGAVIGQIQGTDINKMKPWIGNDGLVYVTAYTGGDRNKKENYKAIQVNTNGTLRRDEWKALDEVVLQIAESRLTGINDLVSRGLVYNLGNGMATTVLEYHAISDALEAELTMDGVTRAKGDRQVFSNTYLPIPLIHCDYEINERVLMASRNMGNGLDVTMAERAARKVSEKLESMLFTSTSYAFGGGTIYSYLNHPSRNLATLGTAWDASGVTGANIVDQVLEWKQQLLNDHFFGPFVLYIPSAYETKLDEDYSTSKGENTIRDRILKISGIADVKVIDTLTADNVLLVNMTSNTVRLVRGMGIQNVQWKTEGNFVNKFKVMTIQVPQIRADFNGMCGIVHAS
jgi:hypothetical protein